MVQNLEGMGFTDISLSAKELMKLLLEQMIAHGGHLVLRWMMDNLCIHTKIKQNACIPQAKAVYYI